MRRVGEQAQHLVVGVGLRQRERRDEHARCDEVGAQPFASSSGSSSSTIGASSGESTRSSGVIVTGV